MCKLNMAKGRKQLISKLNIIFQLTLEVITSHLIMSCVFVNKFSMHSLYLKRRPLTWKCPKIKSTHDLTVSFLHIRYCQFVPPNPFPNAWIPSSPLKPIFDVHWSARPTVVLQGKALQLPTSRAELLTIISKQCNSSA